MSLAENRRLPRKLSEELGDLRARFGERVVTIRTVVYVLRGRAYMLLIILLTLPFLQPIPLPGLSTPFGLAIALVALRLTLGQRPWLPKKIQRKEIPPGFFPKVIGLAAKLIGMMEKFLRPRWTPVTASGVIRQLHALVMLAAALVLMLPLPVPFSNNLPAWAILLVAAGLIERDGLFVALGYLMFALAVVYLWVFGEAAAHAVNVLLDWMRG